MITISNFLMKINPLRFYLLFVHVHVSLIISYLILHNFKIQILPKHNFETSEFYILRSSTMEVSRSFGRDISVASAFVMRPYL